MSYVTLTLPLQIRVVYCTLNPCDPNVLAVNIYLTKIWFTPINRKRNTYVYSKRLRDQRDVRRNV